MRVALAGSPEDTAGLRRPLGTLDSVAALRRPYVVGDIDVLPHHIPSFLIFMPAGTRSYMRAPLVVSGRLIGTIDVAARAPNAFEQRHIVIIGEVADQLAIALQNNQLLEQVRANSERLRALSRQLMEIQENERRHIARELHDEIGQSLTAVKINLETILRLPNTDPVEPYVAESIAIVERVLRQVRAISLDLRPAMLDDLGLESALRWYLGRLAARSGFTTEFSADSAAAQLPPELRTTCFRVVQEALTNVVRHAQARHVRVGIRRRGAQLRLLVADDGIGFDPREAQVRAVQGASLGLVGMQERVLLAGGELSIESRAGQGTTIRALFPFPTPASHGTNTTSSRPV